MLTPPPAAVSVTCVEEETALWDTVNVTFVCPAAIFTVAGMDAAPVFELDKVITVPADGAGPLNITVPVTTFVDLPCTVVGLTLNDARVAGFTVAVACLLEVP